MALLKKLALPRSYMRGGNVEAQYEDELEMDTNLIIKVEEEPAIIAGSEDTPNDKVENGESSSQKKKRAPSKYNIFIKDTLAALHVSHPHLLGKERFALAVDMWNEKKRLS